MFRSLFITLALVVLAYPSWGQDARKVPISFLPPPLETATYSLGIYDVKSGKLVRRLQEAATQDVFTVGLNGLITSWDGKDDAGKLVPAGKYAARGYAVGALKVEGNDIVGNDWAADDENLRIYKIQSIAVVPEDNGLIVVGDGISAKGISQIQAARYGGASTDLLWHFEDDTQTASSTLHSRRFLATIYDGLLFLPGEWHPVYRVADGKAVTSHPPDTSVPAIRSDSSPGKDGTVWKIDHGVLGQYSPQGEQLRVLQTKEGDHTPSQIAASQTMDRIYLLENGDHGQRVRGLSWKETSEENGRAFSTWETFFERSINYDYIPAEISNKTEAAEVEVTTVENPLSPGKTSNLKLKAVKDDNGSYLAVTDGLKLRRISQRANLWKVTLAKGKSADDIIFFQNDRMAWDEFSIKGAKNMMEFDAGEIDMTADGEKTHPEKAAEPPDL